MGLASPEFAVLYLASILLLTFLVLAALLWGGTRLIQAMLYETVQPDLYWRAPAAAAAVTAYLALWALLNYVAAEPGQAPLTELPFDTLFNFTTEKVDPPLNEFWAVRPGGKVRYSKRAVPGSPRVEYRNDADKIWLADREADVQALVVKDGDRDVTFKADPAHKRYVEEGGRRYLDDDSFGRITTPRRGGSWARVLLNVLHLGVWFAVLWLLLGFQWPHALGLAAALWLVMTFVAPYVLRAGAEAKAPPPVARAA